MDAILVVNHFLKGEKFDILHKHLVKTADDMDISLSLETNLSLATRKPSADFVLFWDKDITLARRIERLEIPVFNSASSIELCDNKALTYNELLGTVPQPLTFASPLSFFNDDMSEFVKNATDILGFPVVYKECFGSFGAQVYLCNTIDEITAHLNGKPFILQKFVKESAGCDERIEIVGGKCVSAVKRENKADFRSNVTNGGTMTAITPDDRDIETAVKACEALGLTFGGVDILENGEVCEVNSNAHIMNIMDATGIDIAPIIFAEIMEKIK